MEHDWVKKLGQWHLYDDDSPTCRCGQPMLGNNYAKVIPVDERTKCKECWGIPTCDQDIEREVHD